jgi:ankyrin repeat protein
MFCMNSNNPVYVACRKGDVEALQRMFPDGPTEWRSPGGSSLLHMAAHTPHLPVLDWLLTFPFDVNESTQYGATPLMWACLWRQEAMTRRLLAQGAQVHVADSAGFTSLHYACSEGWIEGATLLLEYGADPEARDERGRLPEDHWPVPNPRRATLRALLDAARQGCGLK